MALVMVQKEGFEGILEDTAVGGIAAIGGDYVFNKVIQTPLTAALKSAGKYAGVAAAALVAIGLNYAASTMAEGTTSKAVAIAGYSILGRAGAVALGDSPNSPTPGQQAVATAVAAPITSTEEAQVNALIRQMTTGTPGINLGAFSGY